MNKRNVITLILGVLFIACVVAGVLLIVKDIQISNEVASEAERIQQEILAITEETPEAKAQIEALKQEFSDYLASKTPIQTALTLSSLGLLAAGVTCFVFAVKRISKDIKEKKEKEEQNK